MNIVILGPGAIGSLWAINLKQAGHNVAVYSRQPTPKINLQLIDASVTNNPIHTFSNNNHNDLLDADLIIVTVKAWQVKSALLAIKPWCAPETIIFLMHNGMGSAEQITADFNNPIVLATTTHAAFTSAIKNSDAISNEKDEPLAQLRQTHHTGNGKTLIGGFNQLGRQCDFLADVLNHTLPQVTWQDNIQNALWYKLAINCVINPLTAIHLCQNGELAQDKYISTIDALIQELTTVMEHENVDGIEQKIITSKDITMLIMPVIKATAMNYSSMYQDIKHQRPTEIDFITGYLLKVAQKYNINVPENKKLYQQIKHIEQQYLNKKDSIL